MTGIGEALAISAAVSLATAGLTYLLTPTQKIQGNRLSDLTSGNSTYGSPVPWAWGKVRLPGNKIWIDYLEEDKKKTKQGKGAKVSTTEYSYYGYYASVFCECPFRPIVDHDRIWMNKKLVFSRSGGAETIAEGGRFAEQYLQFYKGEKAQIINPLLQNASPISNYNYGLPADQSERDRFLRSISLDPGQLAFTPAYNQRAYMVATRLPLGDFFNSLPTDEAEIIASSNCTVGQIISDIFSLFYAQDRYDTSLLTTPVQGFTIDNVQAAKQTIQLLQQAYFFDVVDSNGVFKFIPLNHSRPVINLDPQNLAAYASSSQKPLDFEIVESDATTLPSLVSVQYIDPDLNYDTNIQTSQLEVKGHYNSNQVSLSLPIVMSGTEAANIADRAMNLAWIQKYLYKFALPPYYLDLEPGDLVDNIFDGGAPLKITQTRIGANLQLDCEAVPHDTYFWILVRTLEQGGLTVGIADYNVSIVTTGSVSGVTGNDGTVYTEGTDYVIDSSGNIQVLYTGTIEQGTEINIATTSQPTQSETDLGVITSPGNTELLVLDIPLIRDEDPDYTLYAAAGGGSNWRGASIYVSTDNSRYIYATNIPTYSVYGECLSNFSNSSITVRVNQPELESVSTADLALGFNLALIGKKIMQFAQAQLIDTNIYVLSNIVGGFRSTKTDPLPVVGDRFVLLKGENAEIAKIQGSASDLGQIRYFKAVSPGQILSEVTPQSLTIAGISQRPYSPTDFRATKDGVGNITITWQRRDRHGESIENPPMSEDFEQYVIRIMSASTGTTVVRSWIVNSSSYRYSATDQTADFGGVIASVTVKVAQVSSTFGNGAFATATLSASLNEPAPRISSFTPASASVGATITLSGTSLAQIQTVKIGDELQSNLAVIDNETISFVITPDTISDRLTVTTTGGSVLSAYPLIVT
jgi:hypothetical protein